MEKRTIAAIIKDKDEKVLIQDHVKTAAYTLPSGKWESDRGETIEDTLKRELFEELGIVVTEFHCIYECEFSGIEYPAGSGNLTNFHAFYYIIDEYINEVVNREPNKHRDLLWLTSEEIKRLNPKTVVLDAAVVNGFV